MGYALGLLAFLALSSIYGLTLGFYTSSYCKMRRTTSMKRSIQSAVSDNSESGEIESGFDGQIKEDIRSLVNVFIEAEKTNKDGFRSINPSFLLDNSHSLTN